MEFTEFKQDLWCCYADQSFKGMNMGCRMTVARLPDGTLWVHSPLAPTPALQAHLRSLGIVAFVVAPNRMHHLHLAVRALPIDVT